MGQGVCEQAHGYQELCGLAFFFFFFLLVGAHSGDWRLLSVFLLCSPGSLRRQPQPHRAPCLELSFVEDRMASSPNEQIPRCEPIRGCHVFPDEIPDLVCCVFLETHSLPPKTSAGKERVFSLNYPFLKWCQIMPHFRGLDTPVFPLTAFSGQT